ncbi:MAG: hypothetical protein Fur007_12130 [Rhodoferax sp.]
MPEATRADIVPAQWVQALERATLEALSPQRVLSVGTHWLLPLDPGPMARSRSAVPLAHCDAVWREAPIDAVCAAYRTRQLPVAWRLPCIDTPLHRALHERGFRPHDPTWVLHAPTQPEPAPALPPGWALAQQSRPDALWQSVFLGPGFDANEGQQRMAQLARHSGNIFWTLTVDGQPACVAVMGWSHGWVGVHGLRTHTALRGRGLASALLRAVQSHAHRQRAQGVFLQVGADNPALALYRRRGWQPLWCYAYWRESVNAPPNPPNL